MRIAARRMTLKEAQKVPYFASQLPCNAPRAARGAGPSTRAEFDLYIMTFYSTRLPHSEIQYQLQMIVS